jgi:hypothetical protein
MTVPSLTPEELDCLRGLSAGNSRLSDLYPRALIGRLLEKRLIEPIPMNWVPVPIVRSGYRLTAVGQAALDLSSNKW